jgi:hypothetical protein
MDNHSVAVVQYTFTHKQYIEQHKTFGRVRAVPRLCGIYPGICLTTEKKTRKDLSQVLNLTLSTEYSTLH